MSCRIVSVLETIPDTLGHDWPSTVGSALICPASVEARSDSGALSKSVLFDGRNTKKNKKSITNARAIVRPALPFLALRKP
jgi:hypothetical protein